MLLFRPPKILCSMYTGPTPLQLMSSIHGSEMSGSSTPMPILSRMTRYFRQSTSAAVTWIVLEELPLFPT